MLLRCAVLVLAGLAATGAVRPDSWEPFADQRVVSASGLRYVVVREAGDGITYELCERAAGAPPMTAATRDRFADAPVNIDRDPADRLRRAGRVAHLPYDVLVPDTLDGFLLFETYYRFGRAKSATYIDGNGTVRFSLTLGQIFAQPLQGASITTSSTWWNRGFWIDEAAHSVVVVALDDEMREIAIADGAVTTPDISRLLKWCMTGLTSSRTVALEVLGRRPAADRKKGVPLAMEIFHDAGEPMAVRLRAAMLLCAEGVHADVDALFAAARAEDQPREVRQFAVRQLPAVLGDRAIPILRDLMRGPAGDVWGECYQAFIALGERAVPTLIEMVQEQGESSDYRGGAAHALGAIRSPVALHVLLAAAATADDYTANAALNAAIATGGEGLTARLITMLAAGSTQDGRIALYLAKNPTRHALSAIDAALARHPDDTAADWLREARAACEK